MQVIRVKILLLDSQTVPNILPRPTGKQTMEKKKNVSNWLHLNYSVELQNAKTKGMSGLFSISDSSSQYCTVKYKYKCLHNAMPKQVVL